MTDLNPPPEEPLGDQARARIRAELLAVSGASPERGRRWAVPLAAAAAVVLVAGATAWAAGTGGDDGAGTGPATSTSPTPSPEPAPALPDLPAPTPTSGETGPAPDVPSLPPAPTPTAEAGAGDCATELENVLPGAEQVVAFPTGGGTTSFWVRGDEFSLCDVRAGTTTVHRPLPLVPERDVATYRVSSLFPPTQDGYRTVRVAGGIVPEGYLAYDVAYTFPDGHRELARTIKDEQGRTWWWMVHAYDDGGGNETRKPPIEVEVTLSGTGFGYSLEWGTDTCAQANHGC
jgi:hypothetical protein